MDLLPAHFNRDSFRDSFKGLVALEIILDFSFGFPINNIISLLAEWIELKETLAKFQAERGNETSDDKGSDDMPSKAERKQKSNASPVEFCRRSLAGGNVWDFLTDSGLLKIMKLRGVGADDIKEVREIVQHLFTNIIKPARSKRNS